MHRHTPVRSASSTCPCVSHFRGFRSRGGALLLPLVLLLLAAAGGALASTERVVIAETDSPVPSLESLQWGQDAGADPSLDPSSLDEARPADPTALRDVGVWSGRGPWGGNIRALAVSPHNPLHVLCAAGLSQAAESGGMWVSEDGGINWQDTGLQNIPVYGVAASASEPGVFYGAAYRGLHRSTDGGYTWTVIAYSTSFVLGVGVKADDPNVLIAGLSSDQGIRRSTDGGATWNLVGLNTGFFKGFATSPTNPSRMYVAISSEPYACYRSDDGGATWAGAGPAASSGYGIWMDPMNPDRVFVTVAVDGVSGIYRTTDGGSNWTRVLTGTSYAPVAEKDGELFAAIIGQGVYRSSDGGDNWALSTDGIVASYWQASTSSGVAPLFGHWGGIYRWDAAASRWVVSQTGLNNAYVRTVAYYHDTGTLWAGTDQGGLWRSLDSGATWELVPGGLPTWTIQDLVPQDHHRYSNPRMALATDNGLFISDDEGETWAAAGQQGQAMTDVAIDWTNPNLLWAGLSTGGVYWSTNGGATWSVSTGIPFEFYPDVELSDGPSGTRVVVSFQELLGNPAAVYYSDDGGVNFIGSSAGLTGLTSLPSLSVRRGAPGAGGMLYCSTNGGIYRSLDGGVTWSHAGTFTGLCWSVLGSLSANVFAGRQGQGTYWSPDEGLTWQALNAGMETATVWAMVHGNSGDRAFAATRGRGVKQLELESSAVDDPVSAPVATSGTAIARPNPFGASTRIAFQAPAAGVVSLRVFDAAGRPVAEKQISVRAGSHEERWDGRVEGGALLPGGAYFYRLEGAGVHASGRCILIR